MTEPKNIGRLVVVSGLSGSGKSTVLKALEDIGYLTIDNLPSALLTKFLAIRRERAGFKGEAEVFPEPGRAAGPSPLRLIQAPSELRLAVGMDAREPELVDSFEGIFKSAREMGYELRLLFIEAEEKDLVKRFSETRRPHHLAPRGGLLSAIRAEREHLAPLRRAADEVVDTSSLKASALRELIMDRFSQDGQGRPMSVDILSFGFKNGLPPEADLMVDVRFLPNPFYLDELRDLDGRDQAVIDYVMAAPETAGFLDKFTDLLAYLLPLYQKEGKSYLTIAVGCTGGQHRSVAVARALHSALKKVYGGTVQLRHRDIAR